MNRTAFLFVPQLVTLILGQEPAALVLIPRLLGRWRLHNGHFKQRVASPPCHLQPLPYSAHASSVPRPLEHWAGLCCEAVQERQPLSQKEALLLCPRRPGPAPGRVKATLVLRGPRD